MKCVTFIQFKSLLSLIASVDATGIYKDAKYLLDDIKKAIVSIGADNVFIVAMDGACKKTLRMIMEDMTVHKIFAQRCSTHGCNLLVADIGKLFPAEIHLCVRLVKFIVNHDGIFAIMQKLQGSLQLFTAVETRFCSQIYSSEVILKDKLFIREVFAGAELREYLLKASEELRNEYTSLDADLVSNPNAWERIQIFVEAELPLRTLLRVSDGHAANLPHMCYGYEDARGKCLAAVDAATLKYPDHYSGLRDKVIRALDKRAADIVTPLCLAACMVLPLHVYGVHNSSSYNPPGGNDAIVAAIDRYYHGDISSQVEALKT
jgi:hypothetical protein